MAAITDEGTASQSLLCYLSVFNWLAIYVAAAPPVRAASYLESATPDVLVADTQRTTGRAPTWWTASCATRRRTWWSR